MPVFQTPEPIVLTADLTVGRLIVEAEKRSDTEVIVSPSNPAKRSDVRLAASVTVENRGGNVVVRAPRDWTRYTPFGGSGSVDLSVAVPRGSEVRAKLSMGPVDARGELGPCTVGTGLGAIRFDRTGPLDAHTGHGDVTVESVAGSARIRTGSGAVRVGTIDGTADIWNSNGDTTVGDIAGDLTVKAANGSVSVDRAGRSVYAKSANGNLRLGSTGSGSVTLETAVGDVEIGVRHGTSAWLDAGARHGHVRNLLEAAPGPADDGPAIEVRAQTTVGDVVITRAHDRGDRP